MKMRIKIDRIYGTYYIEAFDKFVVVARCYINGNFRFQRLFFNTREEMESLEEGEWIDY